VLPEHPLEMAILFSSGERILCFGRVHYHWMGLSVFANKQFMTAILM